MADAHVLDAQGWTDETKEQWLSVIGRRSGRDWNLVICRLGTGEVLGTVSLDWVPDRFTVGVILGPAGRGQGLGQEALRGALATYRARGLREVFLETAEDNTAMRRIAVAVGFQWRGDYIHRLPNGRSTPAIRYSIYLD